MTDSLGRFEILQVKPGIYSLTASFIGYRTVVTPEYQVSARDAFHRNRDGGGAGASE